MTENRLNPTPCNWKTACKNPKPSVTDFFFLTGRISVFGLWSTTVYVCFISITTWSVHGQIRGCRVIKHGVSALCRRGCRSSNWWTGGRILGLTGIRTYSISAIKIYYYRLWIVLALQLQFHILLQFSYKDQEF